MKRQRCSGIVLLVQILFFIVVLYAGCGKPNHVLILSSLGGPLEVRPLPIPSQVESDYEAWIKTDTGPRVLLYEVILTNAVAQSYYSNQTVRSSAPLGGGWSTIISFRYTFASNEVASFHTSLHGKMNVDFLKPNGVPLKFYVYPTKLRNAAIPSFFITAIEGIPRSPISASTLNDVP